VRHAPLAAPLAAALAASLVAASPGCVRVEPATPPAPAGGTGGAAASGGVAVDPAYLVAFKPLPKEMTAPGVELTEARVQLGRRLYFDTRFSKNQDLSCNSCHLLDKAGVDGLPTSKGHKGQFGGRNAPTVLNAAGHFVQFWDGRAKDVEEQAKGPILNPIEMAMPGESQVLAVLRSIPAYADEFKAAFPGEADPITYDNVAKAIGAFERRLVTPSRFDAYLKGDKAALSDAEKQGLITFTQAGCTTCHAGPYLGGHMYQIAGLVRPWPNQKDLGRYEVTRDESHKMMFKVPSLRNVTRTGPYFHDGSVASLKQAVTMMGAHQLGKDLSESEVDAIVAFLGALEGDPPAELAAAPAPHPSGPDTPKPDPN
jgi:cytochrome c peroxidase